MMNKLSKFEVTIDVTSLKQVEALSTFLTAIGEDIVENTEVNGAETVTEVKPKRAAAAKKTPAVVKEDVTTPAAEEAEEETATEVLEQAHDIKIEDVRALLSKTVKDDDAKRQLCKDKLTQLGANNISTLDVAKYPAFVAYMKTL